MAATQCTLSTLSSVCSTVCSQCGVAVRCGVVRCGAVRELAMLEDRDRGGQTEDLNRGWTEDRRIRLCTFVYGWTSSDLRTDVAQFNCDSAAFSNSRFETHQRFKLASRASRALSLEIIGTQCHRPSTTTPRDTHTTTGGRDSTPRCKTARAAHSVSWRAEAVLRARAVARAALGFLVLCCRSSVRSLTRSRPRSALSVCVHRGPRCMRAHAEHFHGAWRWPWVRPVPRRALAAR